jgi:hypothetical protein
VKPWAKKSGEVKLNVVERDLRHTLRKPRAAVEGTRSSAETMNSRGEASSGMRDSLSDMAGQAEVRPFIQVPTYSMASLTRHFLDAVSQVTVLLQRRASCSSVISLPNPAPTPGTTVVSTENIPQKYLVVSDEMQASNMQKIAFIAKNK